MSPADDPEYLTLREAAQLLGITPRTLARWARDGRIPRTLGGSGEQMFRRSELVRRSTTTTDDISPEQQ